MLKISLAIVVLFCTIKIFAQDEIKIREARFKTGNDQAWSQPGFDDSKWQTLKTSVTWDEQGYKDYDGYAWYRLHVFIPIAIKENSNWKDSLRVFLAKIDDVDETYLNGVLIGRKGNFPNETGGYKTAWSQTREYHISTNDPAIKWNKENVIAVKVYDNGGKGGIFGAIPFVNMIDQIDGVKMHIQLERINAKGKLEGPLMVVNNSVLPIEGSLSIRITDMDSEKVISNTEKKVTITPSETLIAELGVPADKRLSIAVNFKESITGKIVGIQETTPYILTPLPSPQPRINGAKVFGVRPGSPFLFKISATGSKPLTYAVKDLPQGLKLDAATGIITGKIVKAGKYKMIFIVKNKSGESKKEFTVQCGDLLALTPPMGWNSWNCWGLSVSDEKLKSSAQAMIDKGLIDHGWTYMNIDDGWEAEARSANGEIPANKKFPDMKGLGNWLHDHGLKFGIYSSPGPKTCGGYLGSYQHELQDAKTYANWGIDYLKYDWCSYGDIAKNDTTLAAYQAPYKIMQQALRSQKRDLIYSLCQYGMKNVSAWGAEVDGNCWRTTGDITDNWNSLSSIGFSQGLLSQYAKPGRWNDPDMMIVGQVGWGENLHPTHLTPDEQYTHVSLWCLLSAPLLIGCDLSKLDAFTLNLLTNDEVLAIDQDVLGKQARQIIKKDDHQVWVKELEDGNKAIGIFNLSDDYQNISVNWNEIGLPAKQKARDLWRQKDLGVFENSFTTKVAPHGVTLIKVSK
jgi:hypothetical protein